LIFKRTSLISFQKTRLWIDIIFEIWEVIPEQGRLSNKEEHRLSLQNPWQKWRWHFSTLLEKWGS
jgi:hypothetical protein